MHKLLDDYLCKKYPKIFKDRNKPMTETCMCWGFDIPDSYFYLIDNLCYKIQSHIDNPSLMQDDSFKSKLKYFWNKTIWNHIIYPISAKFFTPKDFKSPKWKIHNWLYNHFGFIIPYISPKNPPYQVVAQQVKSKFGGLRFYYSGGDDYIRGLVDLAESLSYHICEECGKMDETVGHTQGWIITLCKEHSNEKERVWKNSNDKELQKIWAKINKGRKKYLKE